MPESSSRVRSVLPRGLVALADAVTIGAAALRLSLRESTGVEPTPRQIATTLWAAAGGALAVFIVAPALVAGGWAGVVGDTVEASGRAAMLLLYLLVVSRSPATRRLFGYHGAEHKVIAAYESLGRLPGPEDARSASPVHMRCGTNFIALLVIVAGVAHSFLPRHPLWLGALYRVLVAPVDAAVAYEIMRGAARIPRAVPARLVTLPGRLLQLITTREPDEGQLEVAHAAVERLVEDDPLL